MSLDLDTRQRAMLADMGVHVWWPASAVPDDALSLLAAAELQAESDRQDASESIAVSAYSERASGQNGINSAVPVTAAPGAARPAAVKAALEPPAEATAAPLPPATAQATAPSWQPQPQPQPQPQLSRPPATSRSTRATPAHAPAAVLPLASGIAQMAWPALTASVAACQACSMCLGRRAPVLSAPPEPLRADWLVLGEPPDDLQERAGVPFVADAGLLLDNILKAVGVQRLPPEVSVGDGDEAADDVLASAVPDPARSAYLSLVLKCRPALPTAPDAHALAACANFLRREIALVQPKVILAMGRLAMQVLLSEDHPQGLRLPLGKLRGQVWHYQGVPVVVTYPPAYLLRNAPDKARVWEDVCLAADVARGARPSQSNAG